MYWFLYKKRVLYYSKSPLLRTPLLWTAAYYGQQQNPRSVTFFNSVIKTPPLRTLLMDIRQLRTLFFGSDWKPLYNGHQVRMSLYFREKTTLPDCSVMVKPVNLLCFDIFDKYSDWILEIRIFEYPFYVISGEQMRTIGNSNSCSD